MSRWGVVNAASERSAVERIVRLLGVRTDGTDLPAGSLSGGNQQKLVIGKWLLVAPRILLLNDPHSGHRCWHQAGDLPVAARAGRRRRRDSLYSTDYDELVGCCDRVLVMYDGAIKRELVGAAITERALISNALNIGAEGADAAQAHAA